MNSFLAELKRRNVFKVAAVYGITSWLILQVSDVAFPALGLPEWAITLVMVLLIIGLILALILAWAFEMTPEGIKREADVDRSQSITTATGRRLNLFVVALLVAALGVSCVWRDEYCPLSARNHLHLRSYGRRMDAGR